MIDDDDFEPNLNARNTDPGTSHAAADASDAKKRDQAAVYALFVEIGGERGLTDYELCAAMHSRHGDDWEAEGKSRKRRCDLARDGHLEAATDETGKVLTRRSPGSGKGRIVWVLSEAVRERRAQAEVKLSKPEQLDLSL